MNVIKKLMAAATAAASMGMLSVASAVVYADETTTTTTEVPVTTTTAESGDVTTTENTTTTVSTDTSDTSDTTTVTTAPVKYKAWISFNKSGNKQTENAVEFSTNGTYTVKYKFDAADAAATISSIVLESDVNSESVPDFKFKVTGIKCGPAEGTVVSFDSTNNNAFTTDAVSKTYLLNIINKEEVGKDLSLAADFKPNADDTLFVTFTVEGLAEPETTTTTTTTVTRTITYSGKSYNNSGNNTTTNTVSKTADEGVIAIVVSSVAAAALAVGAVTMRRKRK